MSMLNDKAKVALPKVFETLDRVCQLIGATWEVYHVYDNDPEDYEISVNIIFEDNSPTANLQKFVNHFKDVYGGECDSLIDYGEFVLQDESTNLSIVGGDGLEELDDSLNGLSFRATNNPDYIQSL